MAIAPQILLVIRIKFHLSRSKFILLHLSSELVSTTIAHSIPETALK